MFCIRSGRSLFRVLAVILVCHILFLILLQPGVCEQTTLIGNLLKKWAPLVWLAPEEKYFPLAIEEFLQHVNPADINGRIISSALPIGRSSESLYMITKRDITFSVWIHFSWDLSERKSASNSTNKTSLLSPNRSSNSSSSSKRGSKTPKDKRKSNKADTSVSPGVILGATQWYTADHENNTTSTPNGAPIFELRQELTPQRPLRSEVEKEKRLSRPNSGQYSRPSSISLNIPPAYSSGNSSNRDSIGTTDSSISEEDVVPPPLPVKSKEVEYCNLPISTSGNQSFLYSHRSSMKTISIVDQTAGTNEQGKTLEPPPTPPPKPPKKKRQ